PGAALAPRGEALDVSAFIPAARLAVDPAIGERLLQGLVVDEPGRRGGAPLGEDQPDAFRARVLLVQPVAPGGRVADNQLWLLGGHRGDGRRRLAVEVGTRSMLVAL